MKKELTERQYWQIWSNEYKRSIQAGFDIATAIHRADASLAEKRAQIKKIIAADNGNIETTPENQP